MDQISAIRNAVQKYKGQEIKLYVIGDRNRIMDTSGVLEGVYRDIFTVLVDEEDICRRYSFSYREILTRRVRLSAAGT